MRDRAKGLLKQLRALFFGRAAGRDLDDELSFHVAMATAENERRGMNAAQARRAALVAFGGVERYAERVREGRWTRWVEELMADVRQGGRMLVRRPGFAAAVVATLGLGIGGTTAVFSVVDGLFLRAPDGVTDPSLVRRIFIVRDTGSITTVEGGPGSWPDYEAMRAGVPALADVAASIGPQQVDLSRGPAATQVRANAVSEGYLELLGVRPAIGRLFLPEDDASAGAELVALISHSMWRAHFGSRPDVLGTPLLLGGQPVVVVGVVEEGFTDIHPEPVDVWLPSIVFGGAWRTSTAVAGVHYIGRLARATDQEAAVDQAEAALRHAAEDDPSLDPTPGVHLRPLRLATTPGGGTGVEAVALLLGLAAALVLLIACANVANLLLARAITRRRELALRLSLGAGRWRVARQHLAENLVLALLGGVAGVLLAYWGIGLLRQFPLPPSAGRLDGRLLGFALGVSLLTGLLSGVVPAVRATGFDPIQGLREARLVGSATRHRTRWALVVLQVSISLTLLVGAGLSLRSVAQILAIDGGVDLERLLSARVDLRAAGYTGEQREAFYERALVRVTAMSGVERAALVHFEPYTGSGMGAGWHVPGRSAPPGTEGPYLNTAGVGYFETAGTRLLAGRAFDGTERPGTEPLAVVNEAMAKLIQDDGRVVGRCVPFRAQVEEGGCTRIVGVVETQRRRYLEDKAVPMVYLSRAQAPDAITWGGPVLLVRTRTEAAQEVTRVRAALQSLAADLPYVNVQPLTERIRSDVQPYRLGATLFSLFGLLALGLAALGLYAVLGYFVAERTAEIGIRRSLGAPVRDVLGLVLGQGMMPVAIGLALGLVFAFMGTRLLAALLFGVDARDPFVFAATTAVLLAVGLLASVLPAVRAARVSPMVALRTD
jgi:putative ABC transport system permease protein